MRCINLMEQEQRTEFALKAAEYFADHPAITSFTSGGVEEDALFALRWGLGADCVMVFTIKDEPEIYEQIIAKDK